MEATRIASYRTKQELVYLTLKEFILGCVLRPGERLVIRDVATRLSVSETPVRVALTRLASEGLVEHVSHIGAIVGSVNDEDILEIHLLVGAIQGLAAWRAARLATREDLQRVGAALSRIEALSEEATYIEYATLNRQFHRSIAEIGGTTMLLTFVDQLLEKVMRARSIWATTHHREHARSEHREILGAIEAGRGEEARAAEERHWLRAGNDFANQVEKQRNVLGQIPKEVWRM